MIIDIITLVLSTLNLLFLIFILWALFNLIGIVKYLTQYLDRSYRLKEKVKIEEEENR